MSLLNFDPATPQTIAFIDAAVADHQSLALSAMPGVEVVLLDANQDGIAQITAALSGRSNLDSIQILSHGSAGKVQLGSTELDASTIASYQDQLQQWRSALADDADILLYGCNVAAAFPIQNSLIDRLSQFTGADVAASNNLTGAGGDWKLEVQTGAIDSSSALQAAVMQRYQSSLNIITVTSAADSGAGSLREAIATAPAGSTIRFASSLAGRTITLTSGQLNITQNLNIDGAGAAGITISANRASRVISIEKGLTVSLSSLTIANGRTTSPGGGVNLKDFGVLTVTNCRFNNNAAGTGGGIRLGYGARGTVTGSIFTGNDGTLTKSGFGGGAIATAGAGGPTGKGSLTVRDSQFVSNKGINGGAIYSLLAPLTVENSLFRDNRSGGDLGGGAIFTDGGNGVGRRATVGGTIAVRGSRFENNQTQGEGGALFLYGYGPDKIILEDSTVIGNRAIESAQGIARGGGMRANRAVTIRNVTFANNVSAKQGGGLWVDGNAPINIVNSTFSGNQVTKDAGGAMFLRTDTATPVNIVNSTIVNNSAGRASGAIWTGSASQAVTLRNSIVARNTAKDPAQQQVGFQLRDGGGNIEFPSPAAGRRRVLPNSQIADPRLGVLQDIGGDLVHPLLAGSPAINRGVLTTGVPTVDQRGVQRDRQVDIGAFEAAGSIRRSTTDALTGTSRTAAIVTPAADAILTAGTASPLRRSPDSGKVVNGFSSDADRPLDRSELPIAVDPRGVGGLSAATLQSSKFDGIGTSLNDNVRSPLHTLESAKANS